MNRNHLIIAFALLLLAAVVVILMEPPGGFWDENGESTEHDLSTAVLEKNGNGADQGDSSLRTPGRQEGLEPAIGEAVGREQKDPGIASFLGRVVNSKNLPVEGARVTAYGMPGRARGYDPNQPAFRPYAKLQTTTDAKGRFSVAESPHEG